MPSRAWGHGTLTLPGLRALAKTLDGTDAGSSTRSKLVLQLAHGTLGSDVGRSTGILRHGGVGHAWLLLHAGLLLDIGVGLRELTIHILRAGQTIDERKMLAIDRRAELGCGVRWGAGLLSGSRDSRSGRCSRGRRCRWWSRIPWEGGDL